MSCDDELDPERLARDSVLFSRKLVELAPGRELRLDPASWQDAIVFVRAGEIELECVSGERRRFARASIVCFTPVVRLLRNSGDEPVRLIAISRRTSRPLGSG